MMKKHLLAVAATLAIASLSLKRSFHTQDIAFQYRMGSGFPGTVTRSNPSSQVPALMNTTTPVRLFGDPAVIDTTTNSYRGFTTGDTGITVLDAVLVRPYPTQQTSGGMSSPIGGVAAPASGVADFLNDGYIIVKVNGAPTTSQPTKKGAVFVWVTASSGSHVQGGFEFAASAGNTAAISNAFFNGPVDANGYTELRINSTSV